MTKRTKIIGGSVIALVIVVLAVMVSIVRPKTEADIAIPLPFGFDDASSSLVGSITPIGVKNGISVQKVLFPEGTDAEVLSMDSVYLVTVPDDDLVDDMPLDQAFTLSGSALVNYFGYKYSSVTALAEKANKSSSIFTEKFPGQFFVSAKARAEDAQHGNAIATFEANNSITMAATDTLSGALLSRNSLYFLIVNEASGATLTVRTPAMCGDGDMESSEACDDTNTTDGDGCSNVCAVESGYSCTGEPSVCTEDPLLTLTTLSLPAERSSHTGTIVPLVRFTVTTGVKAIAMENLVFTGVNGVPLSGSDTAYMLAAGNSEGDYNIRDIDLCVGGPDEILCENVPHLLPGAFPPHSTHHFQLYGMFGAAQTGVSLQLDASANTALHYAVTDDGENSIPLRNIRKNGVCQTAPCEISLTTIPSTNWTIGGEQVSPVCGDTIIDVNNDAEECDDGNLIDSDFCSNQCTFPAPPASCGNGNVEVGETCDDADTSSGDGCSNVCAIESGYSCTGEPSVCTLDPVCGNGDIEAGETCDDSNTAAADGCSATCAVESGFVCSGEPSSCHAVVCGDGQKEGSEACDDTNTTDGDGCSATCTVESGFACTGSAPSTCAGICGDGLIKGSEACDDGDTSSGDGCSATCTVESGFSCTSEPSSCTTTCGDNICAGTEPYQDIQCPGGGGGMCSNPNYCALDCAVCGNFIIESPVEQCDDGNTNGGDGCSSNCQTEL